MKTAVRPTRSESAREPRAGRLGALAGLVGIGCCIYPLALVLLGISTATEAIALGNTLYGTWGWAFKIAGGAFAVAGITVQLRRRGECTVQGARKNWRFIARVVPVGLAAYWIVYAITKSLAAWGS